MLGFVYGAPPSCAAEAGEWSGRARGAPWGGEKYHPPLAIYERLPLLRKFSIGSRKEVSDHAR